MQYSTKRRLMLGMTTGGLMMTGLGMATAHADTTATGETTHSPGIASGNLVQLPIYAPINVCGNQVQLAGVLDTVTGVTCADTGGGSSAASGSTTGSSGIGSGNDVQIPISAPINLCGNQVGVLSALDTVADHTCGNTGTPGSPTPPPNPNPIPSHCGCTPPPPPPTTPCPPSGTPGSTPSNGPSASGTPTKPSSNGGTTGTTGTPGGPASGSRISSTPVGALAHTGSGALVVAPLGAGLIGGGLLLRRRFAVRSR